MSSAGPTVVIQARAGSTRLPGKVLMDLGGQPMLAFQLARLASLPCRALVEATSDLPGDDAVAEVAAAAGVPVVRGSEADVLGRFGLALDAFPAADIVRLTGDCPLSDPALVAEVVALHRSSGADYTCNVLPRSFPKGLDVEVMRADALRAAVEEADGPGEREHVTPFLYRRPERFALANLMSGLDLGEEWWTVDTADDLDSVRAIVASLADPIRDGWRTILDTVGRRRLPRPSEVHLRPLGSSGAGQHPWVRRWAAERDGTAIGRVSVTVGSGAQARAVESADPTDRVAIEESLDRLLVGDQQLPPS